MWIAGGSGKQKVITKKVNPEGKRKKSWWFFSYKKQKTSKLENHPSKYFSSCDNQRIKILITSYSIYIVIYFLENEAQMEDFEDAIYDNIKFSIYIYPCFI